MNIRFAPDSVRIRISLDEVRVLERAKLLIQKIPFVEEEMSIEVSLERDRSESASFCFLGHVVRVVLREQDFRELLSDKASRNSCIRISLGSRSEMPLEFVFEIDLHSKKQKKEAGE